VEEIGTKMRGGFRIRIPSVPRASIIWLAHAVKVVRPVTRRLHLDRVRFAIEWHLGITLGVCMSGFETIGAPQMEAAFGCEHVWHVHENGNVHSTVNTVNPSAR
jgi:hypothetical protein